MRSGMTTRKCENIYFPKYFMGVRKFTNTYIPKYCCTSVNINGRLTCIHYSSFASYVICHYYIKKATDRLTVA